MAFANGDMTVEEKANMWDGALAHFRGLGELEKFMDRPLQLAAVGGNVNLMRKLLARGASANTVCSRGDRIIHKLAIRGNQPAIQALLDHGALVDALDGRGRTALHLAAVHDHPQTDAHGGSVGVITALLQHKASVNHASLSGCTALHNAAAGDNVGAINALVEAGADINKQGQFGRTPLHIATVKNFPASVTALCTRGADMSKTDEIGHTPLEWAIMHSNVSAVEALLDAGVDVNLRRPVFDDHCSALDRAALTGNVDLVRSLLRCGAIVNDADFKGLTALHKAAQRNQVGAIDALLEAGADVHARDRKDERTPIHHASGNKAVEAVHALLRRGASVNAPDKWGDSPLHRAARVSQQDSSARMVEYLLMCGADEAAVDRDGYTAEEVVHEDIVQGLAVGSLTSGNLASNPSVEDQLARARVWRRRRLVVMCRARLLKEKPNLNLPEREAEASRPTKSARVEGRGEGGGDIDDDAAGSVGSRGIPHRGAAEGASRAAGVVERVVGMQEEGVFRNVVKFL